jgi:hypothetical protein
MSIAAFQKFLNKSGFPCGEADGIAGAKTLAAATRWAKSETSRIGYEWFAKNLIGVRFSVAFTDRFTDIGLSIDKGNVRAIVDFTTKPGKYIIGNPLTVGGIFGAGCIKEGQWIKSHYLYTAANKYGAPYFRQCSSIQVYRDGNKDNKLDKNVLQLAPADYYFQIHPMGSGWSIGTWSYGCNGSPKSVWNNFISQFLPNEYINYTIFEIDAQPE